MAIPWASLIRYAPQLISISRDLLQRSQREPEAAVPAARASGPDDGLRARVAALEENERQQAALVERMAEQQAQLAKAVYALHRRERWLIAGLGVLAVAMLALLAWQALR